MSQEKIPTFLGKTGKVVFAKWRDIIEARTGWKPEFLEQVALAAGQYELYVTACEKIAIEGGTVTHRNGAIGQNPWINIQAIAFKNVMTFSNRFGLNPAYSAKVDCFIEDDSEI